MIKRWNKKNEMIRVEKMILSQPRKLFTQSFTFFENKNLSDQTEIQLRVNTLFQSIVLSNIHKRYICHISIEQDVAV